MQRAASDAAVARALELIGKHLGAMARNMGRMARNMGRMADNMQCACCTTRVNIIFTKILLYHGK